MISGIMTSGQSGPLSVEGKASSMTSLGGCASDTFRLCTGRGCLPGSLESPVNRCPDAGEHLSSYQTSVGADGHSLYLGDPDSDEEQDGRTSLSEGDGDVVVVLLPTNLT